MSNNDSIKDTLDVIRRALEDEGDFSKTNIFLSMSHCRNMRWDHCKTKVVSKTCEVMT